MNEREDQPSGRSPLEDRPTDQPRDDQDAELVLPIGDTGGGTTTDEQVEEASEDSFPASDPPSFTGGSSSS